MKLILILTLLITYCALKLLATDKWVVQHKELFCYKSKDKTIESILLDEVNAADIFIKLITSTDHSVNMSEGFRIPWINAGKHFAKRKELAEYPCACLDGFSIGVEILEKASTRMREEVLLPALVRYYQECDDVGSKMNAHHVLSLFKPDIASQSNLVGVTPIKPKAWEIDRAWKNALMPNHPRGYTHYYYETLLGSDTKKPLSELIEALKSNENGFAEQIGMMIDSHYGAEAVPELLTLLKSDDLYSRWVSTIALRIMGPKAMDALTPLEYHLMDDSEDIQVRVGAARAIAKIQSVDVWKLYRKIPDLRASIVQSVREKAKDWKSNYIKKEGAQFPVTPTYTYSGRKGRAVYAMLTNQHLKEVNEYIIEACDKGIKEGAFWHPNEALIEFLTLFHSKSSYYPGRLTPEAEEKLKEFAFKFCNAELKTSERHHLTGDEAKKLLELRNTKDSLVLPKNDNGHLKPLSFNYLSCLVLMNFPEYKDRKFDTGETVSERYAIFTQLFKQSFKDWALNGLTPELGSGGYEIDTWACIFQLYNMTTDSALKRIIKMYIDVSLIEVEQISVNTVRSAYKSRPKICKLGSRLRPVRAMIFGERGGNAIHSAFALSDYQPPAAAIYLRKLGAPMKRFEIKNKYLGEEKNVGRKAVHFWRKNPLSMGYSYNTPEYSIGSMQFHPRRDLFAGFASHWFGVMFDNLQTLSLGGYHGGVRSIQDKDSLIYQRYSGARWSGRPLIELSRGLKWEEYGGWIFINNNTAYSAVHILTGGFLWDPQPTPLQRIWPNDPFSPIIVQTGLKEDYKSFERFKEIVLRSKKIVEYTEDTERKQMKTVSYAGPNGKELFLPVDKDHDQCDKHFKARRSTWADARIGGEPQDLYLKYTYSSPFLSLLKDDTKVNISYGGQKWVYDFADL